jgi:predicted PurR-regulated permease PerM
VDETSRTSRPSEGTDPAPSVRNESRHVVVYEISSRSIWQVIGAVLLTIVGLTVIDRTRHLLVQLAIAFFFALAIIPLVERLHRNRGWRRGAAVGVVYGAAVVFLVVMVVFLIPMMVDLATLVGTNWSTWMDQFNSWLSDTFGVSIADTAAAGDAGSTAATATADWAKNALGGLLGAFSTGIGLIFATMTIALFTFYFAADNQRIQRVVLSWFEPHVQERLGWTWDNAVEQTGGYFYSRALLMLINGTGFFFTMVLVGLDVVIALPLAIFAGFVSEFIPAIGTYIGGAVPVLLTLALQGFAQSMVVLGYVLIYQQIENYYLSPKISSKTMTLNGGVAFGSALAGGAIGGPMGAFMALPVAALITSFVREYRTPHEVVYRSVYSEGDDADDGDVATATADPDDR